MQKVKGTEGVYPISPLSFTISAGAMLHAYFFVSMHAFIYFLPI